MTTHKPEKNKHTEFLAQHKLHDALLREFVSNRLWKAGIEACEKAIDDRKADIKNLIELKIALQDEVDNES